MLPFRPFAALASPALLALAMLSAAPTAPIAWPDTEPARHARAYFAAFPGGADSMRAFWNAHGSPAALARRPVEARLDAWRQMHDALGSLSPVALTGAGVDFVEVRAQSERGRLVDIRFACEPDAPHGLIALRVEDAPEREAAPEPADTGPTPSEAEIAARLAAEADSLARRGEFSGAVLLDRDGTSLFARAYGLASRGTRAPNRVETRFNLGSINKIFTHVAIEQLAQAGRLALDDTIAGFLPDYPVENASRITIRMLLEHRAGVPDVLENPALWKDPARVRTMADWYGLVRGMPIDFPPGTREAYSNGGFVLLGEIITRVSGEDYYDYIRRHVYGPAGMSSSEHDMRGGRAPGRAEGYTRHAGEGGAAPGGARDGLAATTGREPGRGSPAGGGFSTVGDLARFARALRGNRLLDAAHTRHILGDPPQLGIAGGSPGVNALLVIAGPYTLAVLSNLDPPSAERFARSTGRQLRRVTGAATGAPRDRGRPD
jgi:CubicO group peptidase (beta-lactamase class C family)